MDGRALQALQELLNPADPKQGSGDCEDLDTASTPYATPAAIGPPTSGSTREGVGKASERRDIWEVEEVSEQQQYEYDDPRPQPKYELLFRQSVGAEDVFLGMGGKSPATASCPYQVVRISLPATQLHEVELRVTDTFLDCSTPSYHLGLHLPHRVQGDKSRAQWLGDSHTLEVTLLLNRKYDSLNQ